MNKKQRKFIDELKKEHGLILGFQEYEKEIAILERALEIAVRTMEVPSGYCVERKCPQQMACRPCFIKHFKELARKEVEDANQTRK